MSKRKEMMKCAHLDFFSIYILINSKILYAKKENKTLAAETATKIMYHVEKYKCLVARALAISPDVI